MRKLSLAGMVSGLMGFLFLSFTFSWFCHSVIAQGAPGDEQLRRDASESLKKACRFFTSKVAVRGGYPYYSSSDGITQWGENEVLKEAVMIQPPGTPAVGMALLRAYQATGDPDYLKWALETGNALLEGQLKSGGWAQVVYFETPVNGRMGDYRTRRGGKWNQSSLDDNQTQAAILYLMELDHVLRGENPAIRECVMFALDSLLKAQLPNGGFPQGWRQSPRSFSTGNLATRKASYPDYDWRTEGRVKNYWDFSTLNDGVVGNVAKVLTRAHVLYLEERFVDALKKLGDFLVQAQMPEPQPAWCQQYNDQMQPIWARKFEPPAISGFESQDALFTLIHIAEVTGETRYLDPVPKAIDFLRSQCLLGDGRLARFYELKSNKPLYMDQKYQLTYDDANPPAHYGWKQDSQLDQIDAEYQRVLRKQPKLKRSTESFSESVREIIAKQKVDGSWSQPYAGEKLMGGAKFKAGEFYCSSALFVENVLTLANYLVGSTD